MNLALAIAALILAMFGCIALALAQERHWQATVGRASRPPRHLRLSGWGLLGASLAVVIVEDGLSFGLLFWPLLTGLGALITTAMLSIKPALLRPIAKCLARCH